MTDVIQLSEERLKRLEQAYARVGLTPYEDLASMLQEALDAYDKLVDDAWEVLGIDIVGELETVQKRYRHQEEEYAAAMASRRAGRA